MSRPAPCPGVTALLVIAKEPVPGRVKTRLTPPFSPVEAAELATAALEDTLRTVLTLPARRRVLVLDGHPGPWTPSGFDVLPQCAGTLDERIAAAFGTCSGPALLIGMDTPRSRPPCWRRRSPRTPGTAATPGSDPPRTEASGPSALRCRTPASYGVCRCPAPTRARSSGPA